MAASADGGEARACAFVEMVVEGRECYGVGIDANIVTASLKAIVSGLNRSSQARPSGAIQSVGQVGGLTIN
jgi:2-isopropylmalate synthase